MKILVECPNDSIYQTIAIRNDRVVCMILKEDWTTTRFSGTRLLLDLAYLCKSGLDHARDVSLENGMKTINYCSQLDEIWFSVLERAY